MCLQPLTLEFECFEVKIEESKKTGSYSAAFTILYKFCTGETEMPQ